MNKIIFVPLLCALAAFSCKDKPTGSTTDRDPAFAFESGKCAGHNLSKGSALDSIFAYSFAGDLLIDFSVWSNCCPDSDRFTVSYRTGGDTIVISVVDTAAHFCRCVCPYIIHAEFGGLPEDHYVVCCSLSRSDIPGAADIIHLADVYRHE